MSLTKCLKQLGIDSEDAKTIRASVKNYLDEGMSQDDAAIAALEGFVGELQQSREDIVKQLPKEEFYQPVYHGTPHKFDKFSLEAIGTGEGAQAYGWGLYFAEKREVAEFYRDTLSAGIMTKLPDGTMRVPEDYFFKGKPILELYDEATDKGEYYKAEIFERILLHGTPQQLKNYFSADEYGKDSDAYKFAHSIKESDITGQVDEEFVDLEFDLGNLVQADIPEDNQLLDWDKPINEQPENIKDALEKIRKQVKKSFPDYAYNDDITGHGLYQLYRDHRGGTSQFASEGFNEVGIKGVKYLDQESREGEKDSYNYVIWDESAVTVEAVNDEMVAAQEYYQEKRGAITFPAEGIGKDKSVITLLENADLSTFLHETGHFFFEVYRDIAADPNAPQQIRDDMSALLKFVDVDSIESWNAKSTEERRAGHEKVAEAFEVYLFEGKAPTTALQSLFQSFRAWLKMTYRSMKQYLSPDKITPEVRQVFDRMLATDEAIAEAEKSRGFAPLFTTQEEAKATDKQWAEYQENLRLAHEEAVEEVEQKGLKDMKWLSGAKGRELKKLQAKANAARKVIKAQVTEEMNKQTAYRAMHFLRKGYFPGEEVEGAKPVKLDSATLKERYGEVKPSDPNIVNPEIDELLVAIAKLGGLTQEESEAQGVDPENWKGARARSINQPVFGKRIFRKETGLSFDAMAEALVQEGYLDEATPNNLLEQIDKSLAGESQYSSQYDYSIKEDIPWQKLSRMKLTSKEGVDPDSVAEMLGFTSGDEMVRVLIAAPAIADAVNMETNQRMVREHGELSDKEALDDAANTAVHNNAHARFLASEGRFLAKLSKRRIPVAAAVKETATKIIRQSKIKDIRPARYEALERKESKAVIDSWKKNKPDEAADHAQKQLLNFYLAKYSREAKLKAESIRKRQIDVQKRKYNPKQVHPDYIHNMKMLLAAYDFRKSGNAKSQLHQVAQWAQSQIEVELVDPNLQRILDAYESGTLDQVELKNYKDMTLEELEGIDQMARHLRFLGGKFSEESRAKKNEEYRTVADSVRKHAKVKKRAPKGSFVRKFADAKQSYAANILLHADTVLRQLDGWKEHGLAYTKIKRPIDDAVTEKLIPNRDKASEDMAAIYSKYYSNSEIRKMNKATMKGLTKWEMISVALNNGNEGGRQALADSMEEGQLKFTPNDITEILDALEEKDFQFAQEAIDYINSFWPELAEYEQRRNGVVPKKVDALPYQTKYGEFKGGYYPLKYDAAESYRVTEDEAADLMKDISLSRAAKAHTKDGMLKERVGSGGKPISLDVINFNRHVGDVVTLLAMGDAVNEVQGLLSSKIMVDAMTETRNIDYLKSLEMWLKDTAVGEIVHGDIASKFLRATRTGFSVSAIGWNFGTIILQPLGLLQSMPVIGYKNVAKGFAALAVNPVGKNSVIKQVQAMSSFMSERAQTFNKDIKDTLDKLHGNPNHPSYIPAVVRDSLFAGIVFTQRYVDVITWLGAYEQAKTRTNVEADLIYAADRAVARSQASGIWSDRTPIERGTISTNMRQSEFVRIWTALGSYFFAKGNIAYEQTKKTDFKSIKQVAQYTTNMMVLFTLEAVMVGLMRATWPDDDDEETKVEFMAKETALEVLGSYPLFREVGSSIQGFQGGSTLATFYKLVGDTGTQIGQGDLDPALIKSINNLGGIAFKYPSRAINRFFDSMVKDIEGEDVEPIDYLMWRKK